MVVNIGSKKRIITMGINVEGDQQNEDLLKATTGSVAIWKGHLIITSEEALYYCDV